jgi:rhamnosyl/mannosyltransferase
MAFVAYLLARPAAPVVVGYHNDIVKQRFWLKFYRPVQQAVLQQAKVILVGTQSYLEASPYLPPFRDKCRVVPYGIPVDRLAPTRTTAAQVTAIRARYGGPLVLFVGRLCYYKGLEVAVTAMREVDATLLIVGQGPLLSGLRRQIRSLKLLHKVMLVGPVDEAALAAYYHACDLLILPSTYPSEAFGLVMLQAQACAKPVVCSDLPGLSTVNPHGQTGLLVPPGNPGALAGAINHLLGNFALRRQLGQAGREQVKKYYTSQLMTQRIEEIYDRLGS